MTARPPDSIVVGPHTYSLSMVPDVDKAVGEGDGLYGHANHRQTTLYAGTDMTRSQQQDTVLHEVLHCVLVQSGNDDEKLVWGLAPLLLDTLQRNPQLVRFLTK